MKRLIVIVVCLIVIVIAAQQLNADAVDTSALLRARPAIAICTWIHEHVEWVGDTPLRIKPPVESLVDGADCADMSLLMIWLLAGRGLEAELILMELDDYDVNHAVVLFDGMYYDPVDGSWSKPEDYRYAHEVKVVVDGAVLLKEFE